MPSAPVNDGPTFHTYCVSCNRRLEGGAFTPMPFGPTMRPAEVQAWANRDGTPWQYTCSEHPAPDVPTPSKE